MKTKRILLFLLSSLLLATAIPARATETDNLTGRNDELKDLVDSTEYLDQIVNQLMRRSVEKANAKGRSCDERALVKQLRYSLNRNPMGEVEAIAEASHSIGHYDPPFADSIYGKVRKEAKGLNTSQKLFLWSGIKASSIRLNNQIIGTDKLGHFFAQGYEYTAYQDWHAALTYGLELEKHFYGIDTSGVLSYGDLNANFGGYVFFRSLFGGSNPYFSCAGGKFVQRRNFTWKDYVTPGWDEGINCSEFASDSWTYSVRKDLFKKGLVCPAEPQGCKELLKSPCAFYLASPACYQAAGIVRQEHKEQCRELLEKSTGLCDACAFKRTRADKAIEKLDEAWGMIKGAKFQFNRHPRKSRNAQ